MGQHGERGRVDRTNVIVVVLTDAAKRMVTLHGKQHVLALTRLMCLYRSACLVNLLQCMSALTDASDISMH